MIVRIVSTTLLFLGIAILPGILVVSSIIIATLSFERYYEGIVLATLFDLLYLHTSAHNIPVATILAIIAWVLAPAARAHVRWFS